MDHPILEVVAESHDAHLVDDMEAARPIEVENRVERSGRKHFVKNTHLTKILPTLDGGRRNTHCR